MLDQRDCAVFCQYAVIATDAAAVILCHELICVHVCLSECILASERICLCRFLELSTKILIISVENKTDWADNKQYIRKQEVGMKLAESLQERADLNKKIEQLKARLNAYALVQEGEMPAEEPEQLKKELDGVMDRLAYLIERINLTNAETTIEGKSLTSIIARKDMLTLKIAAYRDTVRAASQTTYRARNSEIRIRPSISIRTWQKEIDTLSKELRVLDNSLQENNWKTDLIE